jgi:hypothetical protein
MHRTAPLIALVAALALAGVARADDDDDDDGSGASPRSVAALTGAPGAGQNGSPRFVRDDAAPEPVRTSPSFRGEATEVGYRWWISRGRADLGLGLGTLAYTIRPVGSTAGLVPEAPANVVGAGTVLTLGMRYRTSDRSSVFADAASWRGAGIDGGDAVAGKVGIEFKSAQSRFNIAYGGLGLKLAGDARMTLRMRRGGLALFMRSTF